MIQKHIHYCWYGKQTLDPHKFVDSWKKQNPEYKIFFWNEQNTNMQHPFISASLQVGRLNWISNFVRAAVLHRYGGIYLDHDVELVKPLDHLLDASFFLGYQIRGNPVRHSLCGAIMGGSQQSPVLGELLSWYKLPFRNGVDTRYGPDLLTQFIFEKYGVMPEPEDVVKLPGDVALYSCDYFYPFAWNEKYTPECITPRTVAVHYWDKAWG